MKRNGFTLIELVIVLAIVGILLALALQSAQGSGYQFCGFSCN